MFKIFNIEKDTFISCRNGDNNYGMTSQLYINSASHDRSTTLDPHIDERTLIYFDTSDILAHGEFDSIKYRNFITDLRLVGNQFSVRTHPLLNSWDEGIGDEFVTNIGTSWNYRGIQDGFVWDGSELEIISQDGLIPWSTSGGDFDDSINYPTQIDKENMIFEVELSNYVHAVSSGSIENNGVIMVANKINYNLSMNSINNKDFDRPYLVFYKDDYVVETGSAVLYDGDTNNALIKVLNYNSRVTRGETFQCVLNIDERYRVAGFTYSRDLKYLPNIRYRVYYETSDREFIPYSEYTRVPVKNSFGGLVCSFSTENFPYGLYFVEFKYEDNFGNVIYSEKKYFMVL